MLDPDTFLTYVYVMADEFCKGHLAPAPPAPGPDPALARSEVVALAVFGQWARFASERDFYRYAVRHLRPTFPTLPDRSQFNRLLRAQRDALAAFGHHLADRPGRAAAAYEALDGSGWLAGDADIGRSGRRGWYEGFPLLLAVTPGGAVSGFGFGPASAKEQPLAEAFLAARHRPDARYPTPGRAAGGPYLADNGFAGADRHRRWRAAYGAVVLCPPQGRSPRAWPPPCGAGTPDCARSSKPSSTSCTMPSASAASAPTPSTASRAASPPRSPCTTSASGSTASSTGPPSLSPT